MSNSALSVLRAKVRRFLNEQVAANSFWTDADLNAFIQDSYDNYYRQYCDLVPTHGRRREQITYVVNRERIDFHTKSGTITVGNTLTGGTTTKTAKLVATYLDGTAGSFYISNNTGLSSETVTATAGGTAVVVGTSYLADWCDFVTTGYAIEQILMVEDYTDYDPGDKIDPCENLQDIFASQSIVNEATGEQIVATPTRYFFEKAETISSGVVTVRNRIYLGPTPSGNRSLRLYILCAPQTLTTADTYTTGLPDFVENCIVLDACVQARTMEESPLGASLGSLQARKKEAEQNMVRRALGYTREPKRIQYYDVIS